MSKATPESKARAPTAGKSQSRRNQDRLADIVGKAFLECDKRAMVEICGLILDATKWPQDSDKLLLEMGKNGLRAAPPFHEPQAKIMGTFANWKKDQQQGINKHRQGEERKPAAVAADNYVCLGNFLKDEMESENAKAMTSAASEVMKQAGILRLTRPKN
jgi:hypothetical protein